MHTHVSTLTYMNHTHVQMPVQLHTLITLILNIIYILSRLYNQIHTLIPTHYQYFGNGKLYITCYII